MMVRKGEKKEKSARLRLKGQEEDRSCKKGQGRLRLLKSNQTKSRTAGGNPSQFLAEIKEN